jgi:hypothetical protein
MNEMTQNQGSDISNQSYQQATIYMSGKPPRIEGSFQKTQQSDPLLGSKE